jgi:hypothetical protein
MSSTKTNGALKTPATRRGAEGFNGIYLKVNAIDIRIPLAE